MKNIMQPRMRERILFRPRKSDHGHPSADNSDSSIDRCATSMALQHRLGLLSSQRTRPAFNYHLNPCLARAHLVAPEIAV